MSTTETAVDRDPVARVDARTRRPRRASAKLLRKETVEPSVPQKARPPDAPAPGPCLPPSAPPAPPRPSLRKRLLRPAAGVGLLVLAAWSLLPLIFELRSTQAVVNAPVISLRSPIDGTLQFHGPTTSGARADAAEPLFDVVNPLADEGGLDSLKDELALLKARTAGFRQQLQGLSDLRENLSASARKYQEARLRTLELECEGAKAGLEIARALENSATLRTEQVARLQGSSTVSNLDGGATQFAALAAHHNALQAQKAVENFEEQIRCLRGGVQVGPGDGRNNLPYSTQRLHEIGLRMDEVRSALRRTRRSWPNSGGTCWRKTPGSPAMRGSRPARRPKRSFGAGVPAVTRRSRPTIRCWT